MEYVKSFLHCMLSYLSLFCSSALNKMLLTHFQPPKFLYFSFVLFLSISTILFTYPNKIRLSEHGQIIDRVRNLKFARNLKFTTSKTLVNFMKKMMFLSENWYFSVQKVLIYHTVNKSHHNSFILLVFSHVANFRYVANFRFLTLYYPWLMCVLSGFWYTLYAFY